MTRRTHRFDHTLLFMAVAGLIVACLLVVLPGCNSVEPHGSPHPYPGALKNNNNELVNPPSWTNIPQKALSGPE